MDRGAFIDSESLTISRFLPCVICTAKSTGIHYGAVACNGCKCFFRETLISKRTRICFFGGKCKIGPFARGRCRACRWKKCQEVGMHLKKSSEKEPNDTNDLAHSGRGSKNLALLLYNPRELPAYIQEDGYHKVTFDPADDQSPETSSLIAYLDGEQNHLIMSTTLKAVNASFSAVFEKLLFDQKAFMNDVLLNGNTPVQPEVPLEEMLMNVVDDVKDSAHMFGRFASVLSGFRDLLDSDDQMTLLRERWAGLWLILHYRWEQNNEFYYRCGPRKVHFSQYWRDQFFNDDYPLRVLPYVHCLQDLNMSYFESFLFLTAELFCPEYTGAKNKLVLSFLHHHYTQCLLTVLRSSSGAKSVQAAQRVESILSFRSSFRTFYNSGHSYVVKLDVSKLPFRSQSAEAP